MESGSHDDDDDDDDLFDAIVTDPPFGRRERAHSLGREVGGGDRDDGDGDGGGGGNGGSSAIHAMLLAVAAQRLRPGGRLVFWLPTDVDVTHEVLLRDVLGPLERAAGVVVDGGDGCTAVLAFVRARRQPLHSNLVRWLCVYRRRCGPSEPEVQVTVVR